MKQTFSKTVIFLIIVISFSFKKNNPIAKKEEINWMTWEEVQVAHKEKPKKVFVDIYTHWCYWCKVMDTKTFRNPKVVSYINEHYYAVKFNAETREDIVFKGNKYHYVKTGKRGYNELATSLMEGQMSFPTSVFLDENLDVLTNVGGFLEPKTIEPILSFFATDSYLKQKWSQYEKTYISSF